MQEKITNNEFNLLCSLKRYDANWLKFNHDTLKWEIRKSKLGYLVAEFHEECFDLYKFKTYYIYDLTKNYIRKED